MYAMRTPCGRVLHALILVRRDVVAKPVLRSQNTQHQRDGWQDPHFDERGQQRKKHGGFDGRRPEEVELLPLGGLSERLGSNFQIMFAEHVSSVGMTIASIAVLSSI
jgi:hypothetical protein